MGPLLKPQNYRWQNGKQLNSVIKPHERNQKTWRIFTDLLYLSFSVRLTLNFTVQKVKAENFPGVFKSFQNQPSKYSIDEDGLRSTYPHQTTVGPLRPI